MTFRLLELPWSEEKMQEDFNIIESSYVGDGWYYDGNPGQIDYYVAFAMVFSITHCCVNFIKASCYSI